MRLLAILLILVVSFLPLDSSSQLIYSEDFEGDLISIDMNLAELGGVFGGSGANQWTINDSYAGGNALFTCLGFDFEFSVPATAQQPSEITNNPMSKYLHIVSSSAFDQGILASSYITADGLCVDSESNFSAMSLDVTTVGYSDVEFSFWWMCNGSSSTYGEILYSVNEGSTWLYVPGSTDLNNQNGWTSTSFSSPEFDDQESLRFAFRFVNQVGASGSEPSFCIDDIKIEVGCQANGSEVTISSCEETYTSPSGVIYTSSGLYTEILENVAGCDSIVTIDLSMDGVDPNYFQVGEDLVAAIQGLEYQWYECSANLEPIPGATLSVYTPEASGIFALMVSNGICSETSSCLPFVISSIEELDDLGIHMYFENNVGIIIELNQGSVDIRTELVDLRGRIVQEKRLISDGRNMIPVKEVNSIYLVNYYINNRLISVPIFVPSSY